MILFKGRENRFLIQLVIGFFFFCYIAHRLNWIFIYFSLALFLAYFFGPLYRLLTNKGVHKAIAVLSIFIIIGAFAFLIIFFLIPNVLNELNVLYQEIPGLISSYQNIIFSFEPIIANFMDPQNIELFLRDLFSEVQSGLLSFSKTAILGLSTFVTNFSFGIVMVPLILYYLLVDIDLFKDSLLVLVSKENKKDFREVVLEVDRILSKFIRGRFIVCFIVGFLISVGLYFLQVDFYIIIGVVSGILNFIPFLGAIAGWLLSILFVIGKPWWFLILLTVLFVGVNQIEALWLDPKILGRELGLHP
ncbi:MAG: AI-2E family transporter, partial [Candidatus Atribacteria bacterium]|nr:AI-2E family transporter [Candidatus Atribacteria bacterium]